MNIPATWRHTLLLLPIVIGWILFCYWDTATAMFAIWMRSETYAHAFVVPLISLWLTWRKRDAILAERPNASMLLALPIGVTSFLWLLGELTAVNALTQFSLIATLVMAIMALLGVRISKLIAFPLAFLFFSVPFGDFMLPTLMDWTAAFTVLALRASGIPVYQEGLQFVIPSGNWSVIEACSGIRYIIASVTVGTLFAYLNYVSLRRRLIFIGVAIIVPVIANWLRAYMIVMLGHLSNNTLAVGVDHLIYGWVFFGVVIMLMFMIGGRWSESPDSPDITPASMEQKSAASAHFKVWLSAVGIALLTAVGPLWFIAISKADKSASPTLAQLPQASGWNVAATFASWKPDYSTPSAEILSSYEKEGKLAGLYIAYYRNQDYQHKLITSTNSLASSTDNIWSVVTRGQFGTKLPTLPEKIRTAELLGRDTTPETRLVIWQWYWINGKLTSSDIEAKIHTALSRLRGKGDDSAVVMLYAPKEKAADALPAFAAEAGPLINQILVSASLAR
jgi:exosortase A